MREKKYWSTVGLVLFVLLSLDLLTTSYAVVNVGIEYESNEIMQFILQQNISFIIYVHLAALLSSVSFFYVLYYKVYQDLENNKRRVFSLMMKGFLYLLFIIGLFVILNNFLIGKYQYDFIYNILTGI